MADPDAMGGLAAVDNLPGDVLLPPPYRYPGQGTEPVEGMVGGAKAVLGDLASIPQRVMQNSDQSYWTGYYDPSATKEALSFMVPMGSLAAERGAAGAFGGRLSQPMGALADPLWSDLSAVKLRKPVAEMQAERIATRPADTKIISPEDLKIGTVLYPALGDRSIAGEQLLGVGGQRLRAPVDLQGGPGFITRNAPYVWANDQGEVTKMTNRINAMKDRGDDVLLSYFPMAPRSVDFSHHMSDTLVGMLPNATLKRTEAATFNDIMRGAKVHDVGPLPDFPGLRSPNLQEYFAEAPGAARNKFAKLMDTSRFQNAGFPNVAEARYAVTDPTLLHEPYGASGGMFMRPNTAVTGPSGHRTFNTGIGGEYVGEFANPVPKEMLWRDAYRDFAARGLTNPSHQSRAMLMAAPTQRVDQELIDTLMKYQQQRP